jgi:hypothetical protein
MRRKLLSFALFGASCILAQEETPVFRSTAELVLVDVQVVHKKTKTAARPLEQRDFQIAAE